MSKLRSSWDRSRRGGNAHLRSKLAQLQLLSSRASIGSGRLVLLPTREAVVSEGQILLGRAWLSELAL